MKEKQNMHQEHGLHHKDQTLHPEKPAAGNALKDPVCYMHVDKDTLFHAEKGDETIYFCSENCLKKFQKNPSAYREKHERPAMGGQPEIHAPRKKNRAYLKII